jgi:hypothetical protein
MNNGNKMDELEKNIPDNFWRKAFEDAAETPPPRVWDAIERQLDESEGPKILPLWGSGLASSRLVTWGTRLAAAVALLLVGWWAMKPQSATDPIANISHTQQSESQPATGKPTTIPETGITSPVASAPSRSQAIADNVNLRSKVGRTLNGEERAIAPSKSPEGIGPVAATQPAGRLTMPDVALPGSIASYALPNSLAKSSRVTVVSYSPAGNTPLDNSVQSMLNTSVLFEPIAGKPMRFRQPAAIQRIVWVRPAEPMAESDELKSKRKSREVWASVSLMPSSFNPSISIRSVQSSFVNTALASPTASNQSAAVNSEANFSVAYQAGAGVQLSERWSVESGIGYLSGRSTVGTPGQQALAATQLDALANRNTASNNVYLDAVRNTLQAKADATNPVQTSYNSVGAITGYRPQAVYDARNQQVVTNNYQYIQVPVQVGYQIRPRKRLSMAVIGGLLTNIFVRNTVGNEVVVSAKDGLYKPVSLAATMGARFRYRPTRRWSASLAGVYQPSLESGTEADSQVQSRPTSAGMSFGLDYHF